MSFGGGIFSLSSSSQSVVDVSGCGELDGSRPTWDDCSYLVGDKRGLREADNTSFASDDKDHLGNGIIGGRKSSSSFFEHVVLPICASILKPRC